MNRACIAVVDATRARLFTFEQALGPPGNSSQRLVEDADLVNPQRRQTASQQFSDSRPGSNRAPSGRGYAASDHREAAIDEEDRKFAHEIVDRLGELVHRTGAHDVVLVASPNMLHQLRDASAALRHEKLAFAELARDLTSLGPAQLHDHLAALGHLPPRERLTTSP